MICGIFHSGSGLGNQLARYVFTRVKAADLGVDFGMLNPQNFKGSSFMNLDMGKDPEGLELTVFNEERINHPSGADIRPYDVKTEEIKDNTLVDGEFQAEKYFEHRLDEVREWLETDTMKVPDNVCVVNFRGGEYVGVKDLFLPLSYWLEAMIEMRQIVPDIEFRIVTDDVATAKEFFQGLDMYVGHDIKEDWLSIRHAKYLILSNSSFAILPALLNENARKIIAPKFWAGRNVGYWKLPQNEYKKFTYL